MTIKSLAIFAAAAAGAAGPAPAQDAAPATPPVVAPAAASAPAGAPVAPSSNAMVNLIRLLVAQKVITADAGDKLLAQATAEAQSAQAEIAAATPAPAGAVRVPYVPQVVKDEIREQLKGELLADAQTQGWGASKPLPGWIDRIKLSGDLRFRDQSDFYSKSNTDEFIDFARVDANGPVDINASTNSAGFPILNTLRDRPNRLSIRARLAVDATLSDQVSAGVRLASGNDNSPISTTQLLGGGFSKKDIWLDRAFITLTPFSITSVTLGRMPNPFVSTDLLYDEDLNFDGVALKLRSTDDDDAPLKSFATAGVFPFEYGASNYPSLSGSLEENQPGGMAAAHQRRARDKWIFGGQIGGEWQASSVLSGRFAAAYYDYQHVSGQLSDVCYLDNGNSECSTDQTRPASLTKGNTLFLLRDIQSSSGQPNFAQPQYVGLLFKYRLLDVNAEVKARFSDDWLLSVGGDFVRNIAYRRGDICKRLPLGLPVNNIGAAADGTTDPCTASAAGDKAPFLGSATAWMARATIGTPSLGKAGEWSVSGAYKRIGSDSMLDSLTDSDFHLGGTNAKGYVLTGNYMLLDNVRLTARYLSANEISGPPLGIDVLQLDLVLAF